VLDKGQLVLTTPLIRFRWLNGFSRFTHNKPGGRFRLYYLFVLDFANRRLVKQSMVSKGVKKPVCPNSDRAPSK
jgi:hypothetical protein